MRIYKKSILTFLFIILFAVYFYKKEATHFKIESLPIANDFALLDQAGEFHRLSYYSDKRGIVLISYDLNCPTAQQNLLTLKRLSDKYQKKGINFFLIDPHNTRGDLTAKTKNLELKIPILIDDAQVVSHALGFTHIGEVIVIDPKNRHVMYQGNVDHLFVAIKNLLAGKPTESLAKMDDNKCWIVPDKNNISYQHDIVPILQKHCIQCHNNNGPAPWAMTDYEKVKGWAPMIKEVIMTKRMPPPVADLYYDEYENLNYLTPDETKKLIRWLEQGCPNKIRQEDPLLKIQMQEEQKQTKWPWGEPDIIVTAQEEEQIPARGVYEHVKENIGKVNNSQKLWAKAVFLKPSNLKASQSCHVWIDVPQIYSSETARINTIKSKNLLTHRSLALEQQPYPEGTGKLIEKNAIITFMSHYKTVGKPEKDYPSLGIYLSDKPLKPLHHFIMGNNTFQIPKENNHVELNHTQAIETDMMLYGVGVHMHYLGRSAKMIAQFPDGRETVLLSIPFHDLDWEIPYFFKTPKFIPQGTKITMKYVYDNSKQNRKNRNTNKNFKFGTGLQDEMFWGILIYADK